MGLAARLIVGRMFGKWEMGDGWEANVSCLFAGS